MTLIIYLIIFLPNNYIADSVHVLRNTQVHQNTNNYGKSIIELCSESVKNFEWKNPRRFSW
jgi:hypothetical protein